MLMDIKITLGTILNIWKAYNFENTKICDKYLVNRKVFVVNYFEDLLNLISLKMVIHSN